MKIRHTNNFNTNRKIKSLSSSQASNKKLPSVHEESNSEFNSMDDSDEIKSQIKTSRLQSARKSIIHKSEHKVDFSLPKNQTVSINASTKAPPMNMRHRKSVMNPISMNNLKSLSTLKPNFEKK